MDLSTMLLAKIKGKALRAKVGLYGSLGYWPVSRLENSDIAQMPVYCISLASARARRTLMQYQAKALGLKHFHLVDAVEASLLDMADLQSAGLYDDTKAIEYHGRSLTPAEIACSLSHGRLYERIAAARIPFAMIIEDDALFVSRRLNRLKLASIPDGFDVIFLNTTRLSEPPADSISGEIYKDTVYGGSSAAYILSLSGAEKLSRSYLPVIHAADGLLGRSMKLPAGQLHPFRQQGARTEITSYIYYPDSVLNGSGLRFTSTTVA